MGDIAQEVCFHTKGETKERLIDETQVGKNCHFLKNLDEQQVHNEGVNPAGSLNRGSSRGRAFAFALSIEKGEGVLIYFLKFHKAKST